VWRDTVGHFSHWIHEMRLGMSWPDFLGSGMPCEKLQNALDEVRAVYAELAKRPVTRN
jgi:hypothetical protein